MSTGGESSGGNQTGSRKTQRPIEEKNKNKKTSRDSILTKSKKQSISRRSKWPTVSRKAKFMGFMESGAPSLESFPSLPSLQSHTTSGGTRCTHTESHNSHEHLGHWSSASQSVWLFPSFSVLSKHTTLQIWHVFKEASLEGRPSQANLSTPALVLPIELSQQDFGSLNGLLRSAHFSFQFRGFRCPALKSVQTLISIKAKGI